MLRSLLDEAIEDHYIETAWYLSGGNAADAWRILHEVPVAILTIWQGLRAYSNSYEPKKSRG